MMKCSFCYNDFEEKEIQESHDVPCYLFYWLKTRRERKQLADKHKRRWLCKKCHKKYEKFLHQQLILQSKKVAQQYFNGK